MLEDDKGREIWCLPLLNSRFFSHGSVMERTTNSVPIEQMYHQIQQRHYRARYTLNDSSLDGLYGMPHIMVDAVSEFGICIIVTGGYVISQTKENR